MLSQPEQVDLLSHLIFGSAQSKGMKEGNCEDRIIRKFSVPVDKLESCSGCVMVGVLDGHGGSSCADYIQQQLPISISNSVSSAAKRSSSDSETLQAHLRSAFASTDSNFLYVARRNNDNSGSTAATCTFMLSDKGGGNELRLLLGSVGDSRTVLYGTDPSTGRIIPVSENPVHRPAMPQEKRRVESMGAQVMRIQGIDRVVMRVKDSTIGLAVSRAFGDLLMKEPKQVVSAVPEFTDVLVDLKTDQFVVLGTDGVFDFIPAQTIGDIVACADRTEDGLTRAAESIIALARSNGSTDDRTCVIIDFAWAKRPDRENLKISNTYIR